MSEQMGAHTIRGVKAVFWATTAVAAGILMAAPANADPDTDFASELHTYGIYGQRDYNAWIGKITCKRLRTGLDANAYESAVFLKTNLPKTTNEQQVYQFLGAAITYYCDDQRPVLTSLVGNPPPSPRRCRPLLRYPQSRADRGSSQRSPRPVPAGAQVMTALDVGVYVPQMGFTFADMLHRAERCEELGIGSLWLYDHLYGPGVPNIPSLEAWTLATALLSRTERLRVGHMVLCNQFRHPAVLAKMATTLDQISDGRLELGIGSGSIEDEHLRTGLPWGNFSERSERLGETLEILTQAFVDQTVDFEGSHYVVRDMPVIPGPVQRPRPPIVVGGAGEKYTLPLVARFADVWNVPTYALGDLEHKVSVLRSLCAEIGRDPAEIVLSVEAVLALAPDQAALPDVAEVAERRFGGPGFGLREAGLVGTPGQIVDRINEWQALGFGQIVLFTHDRASDATLTCSPRR